MYVCKTESLACAPETITTLLTSYAPIQNKKFSVREKMSGTGFLFPFSHLSVYYKAFSIVPYPMSTKQRIEQFMGR